MENVDRARKRVIAEYKKIAFAEIGGDVKVSDKLRALDAYWLLVSGEAAAPSGSGVVIVREEYV